MDPGTDYSDCVRGFLAVESKNGNTIRYKAFPMRCKSWDCPHCAKVKADQYKIRMRPLFDKPALYMYTFTFYHSKPELEVWSEFSAAWNRFRTAAQKKYGRFSYVRILEHHHESDYPHLHCLIDIRFSDVWIAAELKTAGFGYQCRVEPITNEGALKYVTKYLTKPWTSQRCKAIRRNLRLRVISFGGDACLRASAGGQWSLLAMVLGCSEAIDAIYTDVQWGYGSSAKVTYENTGFDSYELSIVIGETQAEMLDVGRMVFTPKCKDTQT